MGKLKEKLCKPFDGLKIETSNKLVKIADDYAIQFAVWVAKEFWSSPNCKYSAVQTPKELLEIFKKERGL
jgi:hypothetical protein